MCQSQHCFITLCYHAANLIIGMDTLPFLVTKITWYEFCKNKTTFRNDTIKSLIIKQCFAVLENIIQCFIQGKGMSWIPRSLETNNYNVLNYHNNTIPT